MEGEAMTLYRGQLLGGPDDGNFVDATVETIKFKAEYFWALDGEDGFNSRQTVFGRYVWDPEKEAFIWHLGLLGRDA
jgi:hypothetical protein